MLSLLRSGPTVDAAWFCDNTSGFQEVKGWNEGLFLQANHTSPEQHSEPWNTGGCAAECSMVASCAAPSDWAVSRP